MQNKIRDIRRGLSLSQEKLAERIGTTKAQISKLETSQRRLTDFWMRRLAQALGCNPWDLLGDSNPALNSPENSHEWQLLMKFRCLADDEKKVVLDVLQLLSKNKASSQN